MKILLVDDHALFREGVALLLQRLDPDVVVVEAGNSRDALRSIDENPDCELVLLDLGLPDLSGLDAIAAIRERNAGVPVVVLSASEEKAMVLRALDQGAMGFIPKSSTSELMLGALKLVLSKGIYLPASVFLGEARPSAPLADVSASQTHRSPADLGLTDRQAEVLYLILQGKSIKLICRELDLSASTVKAHTSAVLRALNVTTRTQAIVAAGRIGLRFDKPPGNE
jgi:DNA-binding NarL/FixJ family response regulator